MGQEKGNAQGGEREINKPSAMEKIYKMEKIERKVKIFGDREVTASITNITKAMDNLTDVEFRMWLNGLVAYPGISYSHYEGVERGFITTGQWQVTPPEKEEGDN